MRTRTAWRHVETTIGLRARNATADLHRVTLDTACVNVMASAKMTHTSVSSLTDHIPFMQLKVSTWTEKVDFTSTSPPSKEAIETKAPASPRLRTQAIERGNIANGGKEDDIPIPSEVGRSEECESDEGSPTTSNVLNIRGHGSLCESTTRSYSVRVTSMDFSSLDLY
nr:hypothetical protein Iba_chr08dCG7310 [Ipomoea batatas]